MMGTERWKSGIRNGGPMRWARRRARANAEGREPQQSWGLVRGIARLGRTNAVEPDCLARSIVAATCVVPPESAHQLIQNTGESNPLVRLEPCLCMVLCRWRTPHVWLGSIRPRSQCVGGMLPVQWCYKHVLELPTKAVETHRAEAVS